MRKFGKLKVLLTVFLCLTAIFGPMFFAAAAEESFTLSTGEHKTIALGELNTKHIISVSFVSDNKVHIFLIENREIADFLADKSSMKEETDSGTTGGFEDHKIEYNSDYSLIIRNYDTLSASGSITYEISGGTDFTIIGIIVIVVSALGTIVAIGIRASRGEKVKFNKDHKGNTRVTFE
ncbi:hypothetical protein [Candidatus Lokiarchaeum ossiferum]|uniref:hypothetical protein n=1 Tax=Candidatus Lokiarchaeum ossiferum TaxID=2951803 RepID=UPI00352C9222